MLLKERCSPLPEKRRAGREILTPREPAHESLLRSLPSEADIAVARSALKVLWSARNAYDIAKRQRGIFGADQRISKNDAPRALRNALAALVKEAAQ